MNTLKKTTLLLTFIFGSYISFSQQIGNGIETQITNFNTPLLSGAYQADGSSGTITGGLQSLDPSQLWNHLFNIRHSNTAFNYQLQIASTYAENDRLFFRKIGQAGTPTTATWFEIATRKENTFVGSQTISDPNYPMLGLSSSNSASLKIAGIHFDGYGTSPTNELRFGRYNKAIGLANGWEANPVSFDLDAPSGSFNLNGSGNVGIGTPTPVSKLTIWDNNNTSDESQMIRLGISSIYDYRIFRQRADGVLRFDGTQNTYSGFRFSTPQAPNGLTILNGGNVGIGTATPAKKLTVNGDASFISNPGINSFEILGNNQVPVRRGISLDNDPSGKVNFYIHGWQTNASFNFINGANNVNLMSIDASGKVYIGKKLVDPASHPNAKLMVGGEVDCMSLYVLKPTSWQDRVFEKEYKLENLNSVEKYITENKHLPGIKSEKEILEKGYDVNEIDAALLEKIENLYLYIIEQQKEIEALKNKMNK